MQKRIFTAPNASLDIAPWEAYESPASGQWITSKSQRREDMKNAGCREWEGIDSERKAMHRRKKDDQIKSEQNLEHCATQAWQSIPDSKKRLLTEMR